jgi:hypothetical protein
MNKNRVENIIAQFAAVFGDLKPLARDLRNVLFQIRDGAIFTGTFRNSDIMYDGMKNAFSRAIGRLGKEEESIAQARLGLAISIVRVSTLLTKDPPVLWPH